MKRLKMYVLLLAIVLIGTTIPSFINSFSQGFNRGREDAQEERIFFYFNFRYNEGHSVVKEISFCDTPIPIEIKSGTLSIPRELLNKSSNTPGHKLYLCYTICMYILALPTLFGLLWIFITIIKLLRSVFSTQLFEQRNMARIASIGYVLVAIELLKIGMELLSYYSFEKLFTISPYTMDYWSILENSHLILAIIVLVMNELLRIATTMKEEQELTI
ncbi:MAG: DUF2975 domain-containing protein [Phocaeicola sp.]